MKHFKEEIFDNDEVVEENKTIKNLKKDYPDKIEKLEEALFNCLGENDLKSLKIEFPDNI